MEAMRFAWMAGVIIYLLLMAHDAYRGRYAPFAQKSTPNPAQKDAAMKREQS